MLLFAVETHIKRFLNDIFYMIIFCNKVYLFELEVYAVGFKKCQIIPIESMKVLDQIQKDITTEEIETNPVNDKSNKNLQKKKKLRVQARKDRYQYGLQIESLLLKPTISTSINFLMNMKIQWKLPKRIIYRKMNIIFI